MALSVTTSVSGRLLPIESLSQTACQCQDILRANLSRSDERAADDNAVCQLADAARLLRRGNAKSDANRKRRGRSKAPDRVGQRCRGRFLQACDTEPADKINESAAMPRDLGHSVARGRRRDKPDESERTGAEPLLARRIGAHWNVGYENPTRARLCRSHESVGACCENRIEVAEQHDWNVQLGFLDQRQDAVVVHSLLQRPLRACLNHRPVRDGIREWDSKLDDVGPSFLQRMQRLQRKADIGVACRYIADQRTACLFS